MRVSILGHYWELHHRPLKKNYGDCDPPGVKGKIIRIDSKLEGEEYLDTVIHEVLHCALDFLSEEWVLKLATGKAKILMDSGWVHTDKRSASPDEVDKYSDSIYEIIRVGLPFLRDRWVVDISVDLARILLRLGWRKHNGD